MNPKFEAMRVQVNQMREAKARRVAQEPVDDNELTIYATVEDFMADLRKSRIKPTAES